jgi:hypothetical protein
MERNQSAEETRNEYISLMGPELGAEFYALYNEAIWMLVRWDQYDILFCRKPERVQLANEAAGLFFNVVQSSLFENTLLHLSRITDDSPTTGPRRNLTLKRLPGLMPDDAKAALDTLVKDAHAKTKFARDWRNRRIAHSDLSLKLNQGAEPLAPASRADVQSALQAIATVLNSCLRHFTDSGILFEPPPSGSDAETLLHVIRDGLETEKARKERFRSGTYTDEDLGRRATLYQL